LADLPCELLLRSIGYRSKPLPGVPFDEAAGVIPSEDSRVVRDGVPSPGEYVVGWVRRGATGILGTNRSDALDAVESLRADAPDLIARREHDPHGVTDLLEERGIEPIGLERWLAIREREASRGKPHGRATVKIVDLAELLEAAGLHR
jgi:ferredoxin--NADP+ reductase